nr:hypothetical protein [Tanacetum cinerariifolium]
VEEEEVEENEDADMEEDDDAEIIYPYKDHVTKAYVESAYARDHL